MTALDSFRRRRARRAIARPRRGSALILVLVLVFALAGLAVSAIYMASSAAILSKSFDRERDFKYVAEAALGQGKSRLNNDPTLLPPDTGYITMAMKQTLTGADGKPVTGIEYNLYAGRSGLTSGQYGNFASIVAEARDGNGSRFVGAVGVRCDLMASAA